MSLSSFEPNSGLASTEGRLCHAVLGAAQETAALPRRRFLQHAVPEGLCGRELAGCG